MAMLAEPRRKQKWSVDPRNSAWSKDDSKFGQKMLERMGWSKGKGLGKSEQGATEHIKVKVKNNSLGLGTCVSHEDNWIAHQDDFNQLLADLNNCHGQTSIQESTQEEKQENFSLEQKSKSSKKRVHYMKFTKGKDLSSRSETDLACIFGKRSKPSKDQDEDCNSQDSHKDLVKESQAEAAEVETMTSNKQEELNTVTSTLTMQEYFAQRMSQLKKARQGTAAAYASSQSLTNATNGLNYASTPMTSASETPVDSPNISDTEQQTEKRRKKNKKTRKNDEEKAVDETAECVPESDAIVAAEETAVREESSSFEGKKKKKKKKQRTENEEEEMIVEECVTPVPAQEDSEISENVSAESKKRKKKRTHKQEVLSEAVDADQGDGQASVESKAEDTDGRSKKKKRKREVKEEQQQQQEEEEVVEVAVVELKKSKKDKKKKKKDHD